MKRLRRAYQRPGKRPVTLKPVPLTSPLSLSVMSEQEKSEERSREIFTDKIIDPEGVERVVIRTRHTAPCDILSVLRGLTSREPADRLTYFETKAAKIFAEDYLRCEVTPDLTKNRNPMRSADHYARARENLRAALISLGKNADTLVKLCKTEVPQSSVNLSDVKRDLKKLYEHYRDRNRIKHAHLYE